MLPALIGRKKRKKVLSLGLDSSGKTTILNQLKMGLPFPTPPTIGYNREDIQYKHRSFEIWDIGGQYELRQHWKHYYTNTKGLILVIDVSDRARLDEAMQEFKKVVNHPDLAKVPILVYANKQDLPDAMSMEQLEKKMGFLKMKNRLWQTQPSCATTGLGVFEGMKWLAKLI